MPSFAALGNGTASSGSAGASPPASGLTSPALSSGTLSALLALQGADTGSAAAAGGLPGDDGQASGLDPNGTAGQTHRHHHHRQLIDTQAQLTPSIAPTSSTTA